MLTGQYEDHTHLYSDHFDHKLFGSSVSCKVFALCPDSIKISLWSASKHQMQGAVAPKLQSLHPAENIRGNHKPPLRFCITAHPFLALHVSVHLGIQCHMNFSGKRNQTAHPENQSGKMVNPTFRHQTCQLWNGCLCSPRRTQLGVIQGISFKVQFLSGRPQ